MRTNILHGGAKELSYEIRNIVGLADRLRRLGVPITAENIGDPVAKGEKIPPWMKAIVADLAMEDGAYGYCSTLGDAETRTFLAELNNRRQGAQISPDDILFFNGLGDAITKIYGFLRTTARVITPSPTYTTHSASEAAHAGLPPISYPLDPLREWAPDLEELRRRVRYNPSIAAILLINPDNPTGSVWSKEALREMVAIAREFDLFIIADEIYHRLTYNGTRHVTLAEVIDGLPALSLKGISKELPWPGARCGWMEIYNRSVDSNFEAYIRSIVNAKMVEVCSTTLPQRAIPRIFQHPAYNGWLKDRVARYERMAMEAYNKLNGLKGIRINPGRGAFYLTVLFDEPRLNGHQVLPVGVPEAENLIREITGDPTMLPDKRFVYYLLAATGICVVPLSSFNTNLMGFRMTVLEADENRFRETLDSLAQAIAIYFAS